MALSAATVSPFVDDNEFPDGFYVVTSIGVNADATRVAVDVHATIDVTEADVTLLLGDIPDGRPDDIDLHFDDYDGPWTTGHTAKFRCGNCKIDSSMAPLETINAIVDAFAAGNATELMLLLQPYV